MVATPYPAYKTVNQPATRTVGPRKRSATGHGLNYSYSFTQTFSF
ncbi:hypothetical protein KAM576c_11250 [Enterobacter asburiae]|nr:hypothetical protein KAM576c_11250 [Enterobacter asburiae]